MPISNTQELFIHELCEIYDAEHRFIEGQQEMVENATDESPEGQGYAGGPVATR